MRRKSKSKKDDDWLKGFGKRLEELILRRGYKSIYDFWQKEGHKYISRASLNYIVTGKVDPRISTIKTLVQVLGVDKNELDELFTKLKS